MNGCFNIEISPQYWSAERFYFTVPVHIFEKKIDNFFCLCYTDIIIY